MSGRILLFSGHRHGEAQRLLPWFVTGRLDGEDAAWVGAHVADCAACSAERDVLAGVRDAFVDVRATDDGSSAREVDTGWQRMRGRLRPARSRPPSAWQALRWQWSRAPRWLGAAVAAQAVTLLALAFLFARAPASPPAYRALGATPPAASGNLVVVFDPALPEARLRGLLRASQARIVDGPNDAGAYVLAVPAARVGPVRAALRAAPGVTLVATLGPGLEQ